MRTATLITGLLAMAGLGLPAQAGDAAAGKVKAAMCAGCHNIDGNSTKSMYPKLAGQHAEYLIKAINAYKSGDRSDATMKAMTASLSDADVANLAAYFSSQVQK